MIMFLNFNRSTKFDVVNINHFAIVKALVSFAFMLLSITALSQFRYDWKSHIDYLVEQTDSLSLKSQKTFYLPKIVRVDRSFKNDLEVKETWNYTVNKGRVIIFQVRYVVDHREYTEIYYVDNDRLICMENYDAPYLSSYVDQVRKGEIYFLVDNMVRQYIKFGNKKTNEPEPLWGAEYDCLTKFQRRYTELKKYMPAQR
jgi:hypothetical protein